MIVFSRRDNSVLGRWWRTVDLWSLAAIFLLIGFGIVLILAASPAAGKRIGLSGYQLASRQLTFLPLAVMVLFGVSMLDIVTVRRLAVLGLLGTLLMLVLALIAGHEIKGATRWITLLGFSLQPSEFLKPFFAVTVAWMLDEAKRKRDFPGFWIAGGLYLVCVCLLLMQPDLGQMLLISAIGSIQLFLAGLPMAFVVCVIVAGVLTIITTYFTLPHVTARIDSFLDPQAVNQYQIDRSLEAFRNGGFLGRGPGEGIVKFSLPDSHSDFIFAVAGEELGLAFCLIIVALFCFVALRGFTRLLNETNLFVLLASAGLLSQFALQAIINMASTLRLIPTKGMTLPFISYGGSSLLALALGMGMVLALTRRRFQFTDPL